MKILATALSGLGNSIMALPLVDTLGKLNPERLDVLVTSKVNGEIFSSRPGVTSTVKLHASPHTILRQIAALRRFRYDFVFVPFPSNRIEYNLIAFLLGAKRRVIHSYPVAQYRTLSFLANVRVPARLNLHDVEQNLLLLQAVGVEPPPPSAPTLQFSSLEHQATAQKLLEQRGILPGEKYIVVHPGTAKTPFAQAKSWDGKKYIELCARLQQSLPMKVILVDGPAEVNSAHEICSQATDVHFPILTLRGHIAIAAEILRLSALYVGSDSGLSHLSAAVGTPAVTIFGPADPVRVAPFGYEQFVVKPTCPAFPCFDYPWKSCRPRIACKPPFCINTISVETVLEMVRRALTESKAF